MNNNPSSTPQKKDKRKVSASDFLKEEVTQSDKSDRRVPASEFLNKDEREVNAGDFLKQQKEGGQDDNNDGYENYPTNENPDPVARQREKDGAKTVKPMDWFDTGWNTISKMVPGTLKGGGAAFFNEGIVSGASGTAPYAGMISDDEREELEKGVQENQVALAKSGIEDMKDFQESQSDKTTLLSQVEDPIDFINFVGNSMGQTAAQVVPSILSGGASSIGQQTGIIYLDQIEKIAEKEGITPEEVIREEKDDPASAIAYGFASGAIDYLGAKGVTRAIPFKSFKRSLMDRGMGMLKSMRTEGLTEGGQSIVEQFGSSRGAGEGLIESLRNIDPNEAAEEAAVGIAGGGGINVVTQLSSDITKSTLQDAENQQQPEENTENAPVEESNQPQEQSIEQGIEFNYDTEAPVSQQREQLSQERDRLEAMRDIREETGRDTEGIDNLLSEMEGIESELSESESSVDETDSGSVQEEQENQKRKQRKEEVRSQFNTLEKVEGQQVQYGEYKGTLTRDEEGSYVVDTGDAIVEVQDSRKDPSRNLDELGLNAQVREAAWTGDNTVEITNTNVTEGEQQAREYEFEGFNENEDGDIVSVGLRSENGEQRTSKDPRVISRLLMEDYFRGRSSDVDTDSEVNQAIDEIEGVEQDSDNNVETENKSAIIDDTDPRVEDALDAIDRGVKLTPEENSAVMDWVDDTIDEIERSRPDNAEELLTQLGNFENEINEQTFRPPEGQEGQRPNLGQQPQNQNQGEVNENGSGQEEQGVQQAQEEQQVGTPDNPVTANIDERYQSWIERESDGTPIITIENSNKGKKINYRSNNRKGLVEDFVRQGSPGLQSAESSIAEEAEGLSEVEREAFLSDAFDSKGNIKQEIVLSRSENPAEIAQALESRQEEYNSQIGGDLHITLSNTQWSGQGGNLKTSSLQEWGDYNNIPQNIKAKARDGSKNPGALGADEIAEIQSRELGREVSPDEVVESFIEFHEGRVGRPNNYTDPTSDNLAEKFKEITGQKYTPEFGQQLQEAKQEFEQNQSNEEEVAPLEQQAEEVPGPEQQWRGFGSQQDFEEAQQLITEALQEQSGQLNTGFDPSQFSPNFIKASLKLAGYHLQNTAIEFSDWAQAMVNDLGESIKPALRYLYTEAQKDSRFSDQEFSSEQEIMEWMDQNTASTENTGQPNQEFISEDISSDFQQEAQESIDTIQSNDIDQAIEGASTLAQSAILKGASNYNEFYAWVSQATEVAPNGRPMRTGWEQATQTEEARNMLSINNKEGYLWTDFKNTMDKVRYGITKRMAVYNQRARDVENELSDIFGPEYFQGENAKYLMSWAMDRVPGMAGNMIDEHINPNKPYSTLNQIIRKVGANPDLNIADFNKIDDLFDQLAKYKREGNIGEAESIREEIDEVTKQDDLQQYMVAKHAIESNAYSQEKNSDRIQEIDRQVQSLEQEVSDLESKPNTKLNKSKLKSKRDTIKDLQQEKQNLQYPLGVTTDEATGILSDFENRGVSESLEEISGLIRKLDDMILNMAVESGVISEQDASNMRSVYKHHIPAQRKLVDDNGNLIANFGTTGNGSGDVSIQSRKGSDKVIEHALSSIVSNFEDMVMYSFNNQAKADIARSIDREVSRGNTNYGEIVDGNEVEGSEDNVTTFSRPETVRVYNDEGIPEVTERIVEKAILWADPELAKAVNQSEMSSVQFIPKIIRQGLRGIINLERFVLTGGNPTFLLTNPARDVGDAAFNLGNRSSFKESWKLIKNASLPEFQGKDNSKAAWNDRIFGAHRAIMSYENGNQDKNELTRLFGELKEAGGTSSFFRFRDTKDIVGQINTLTTDMRAIEEEGVTSLKKRKALFKKKLHYLELVNEAMENATRLAVYKTIRDAGKSKIEAARLAKEATVNFDMQGTWSPMFKLGYLFFQVGINSITSAAKGAVKSPSNFATQVTAMTVTGMAVAALRDALGEDEDEYYKDKESNLWKYESNLAFKIPATPYEITVPMGYQVSTFTGFGGHLYDYAAGYSTGEEFMRRSTSAAVSVYNPLGGAQIFGDTESFMAGVAPTGAKPFIEVAVNRSFFGPIYNEMMDANPNISDYQLRSPGDRWVSTMLSNGLKKHADIDMSPKTFDHFIEFVGGGLLRDVEGAGEEIANQYSKFTKDKARKTADKPQPIKPEDWPILRRFLQKVDPVRLSYQNVWNQVNKDGRPLPENSDDFEKKIEGIKKDYHRAKESGMYEEYMFEAMDSAIDRSLDTNHKAVVKKNTINRFRERGWTGSEYKENRSEYYRIENIIAREGAELYPKWENGGVIFEPSSRRDKFTNTMIKDIEVKVNSITDTRKLNIND